MKIKNAFLKFLNKHLRTCVVFNFHDIVEDGQPIRPDQISVSTFRNQLTWISQQFTILRIDQLVEQFTDGRIEKPLAAITFDDGYLAHFRLIKPILDEFDIKAAFYVSSTHLQHPYYWHDIVETYCQTTSEQQQSRLRLEFKCLQQAKTTSLIESIKYLSLAERQLVMARIKESTENIMSERVLMNESELICLAQSGHLIGGHTLNHPILALESESTCHTEICDDLKALKSLLKSEVITFAYPNGIPERDFTDIHQRILASAGVRYAVTTQKSALTKPLNRLSIPRVNLFGTNESLHCNNLLRILLKSIL